MNQFSYAQPFIVVGAFIVRDGKLLLIQENHFPDRGKWNLPAGKLDFGENPEDAARREASEEAGIAFTPMAILGIHSVHRTDLADELQVLRIIYVGNITGEAGLGNAELKDGVPEIADYKWLALEEVLGLDDSELRYRDIKTLVRKYQQDVTYPLAVVEHIIQAQTV